MEKIEKILVLVTAQKSALRLIEYGFAAAQACGGELHILHVQRGDSVFESNDTLRLLQNLVDYGYRRGGVIHLYCEEDVADCIGAFAEKEDMTQVILGRPPVREGKKARKKKVDEYDRILAALPVDMKVITFPEETEEIQPRRKIG